MKPLELTEEHKSKLLEMCEKLFPEYDFSKVGFKDSVGTIYYGLKTKIHYTNKIHWFEFCIKILIEKLNLSNYQKTRLLLSEVHPIDCLYNEFKKLKL